MMSYTHTAHTCSSPFLGAFLAYEGIGHRSRPRDPHSSGPATATAHVRVQLAEYDSRDMPTVQNPFVSRAHDPPNDSRPTRREHGGPQPQSSEIAGQPLRWPTSRRLRPRQRPHGRVPTCRQARDAAAARQAPAVTIWHPTCQMLESCAVVSMAASSEVMRLALA